MHRELTGLLPKAGTLAMIARVLWFLSQLQWTAQCQTLIPENLSNGVKEVRRFFSQVAKYTPGQVTLTVGYVSEGAGKPEQPTSSLAYGFLSCRGRSRPTKTVHLRVHGYL